MKLLAIKDSIAKPLVALLPAGVTPNQLTILRIICAVLVAALLYTYHPGSALLFFVIGMITDLLDGTLARQRMLETTFGRIMDPLADKLLFLIPFIILGFDGLWVALYLGVILIEGITLFAGVLYPIMMQRLFHERRIIKANAWGQYKFALYSIGTILLFIPNALAITSAAILFFGGLLFGYASIARTLANR